ncbi:serine hydrolase [Streptomyces sp. H27-D2]|uniref:serine hydrolase n=1 Tax=Streptomyces sp. H27-D2 TaxID=3046304 RepID=UPI002DB561D1|nr:serine hydrolase [Streptomyces sp. H27-D2]MEC4018092.1 serine hydrolase [Streptomyces sp. H27-D2]
MKQRRVSRARQVLRIPGPRRALSAAVAAGVLLPLLAGAGAGPAEAATPRTVCTSAKPELAVKLAKDITTALRGRPATTAVSLYDRKTKTSCTLRATQKFDSASVVKATVLATLLWHVKRSGRHLTTQEASLAKAMITKSDNAATSKLWRQLGVTRIKKFLTLAGMTQTVPGRDGYWGLTRITARDEQKLLKLLTSENTVLSKKARAYALDLMHRVVTSQRWGTPAGAPRSATFHVKNGWLSRSTHGWRVHSIGAFTGHGHDYGITVLTQDNRTMNAGVATIQAVARAVHRDLNPAAASARAAYVPTSNPSEATPALPAGVR